MRTLTLASIAVALLAAGVLAADPKPEPKMVTIGKIKWHVDYDAALAAAKREGKPLWVHFGENPG